MYERILVLTDGSEYSQRAGRQAVDLAEKLDATVVVTHIIDQRLPISFDILEDRGKGYINEIRNYANEKEVKSEDLLIYGSPKNDVMIISRKSEVDIIVMGTKGATGIKSVVLGSFAQFVLKKIDLPILLIK